MLCRWGLPARYSSLGAETLELSLRLFSGAELRISASRADTIWAVKQKVSEQHGIAPFQQSLIHDGVELKNQLLLAEDCGLEDRAELSLVVCSGQLVQMRMLSLRSFLRREGPCGGIPECLQGGISEQAWAECVRCLQYHAALQCLASVSCRVIGMLSLIYTEKLCILALIEQVVTAKLVGLLQLAFGVASFLFWVLSFLCCNLVAGYLLLFGPRVCLLPCWGCLQTRRWLNRTFFWSEELVCRVAAQHLGHFGMIFVPLHAEALLDDPVRHNAFFCEDIRRLLFCADDPTMSVAVHYPVPLNQASAPHIIGCAAAPLAEEMV
mmetsp:Transcript_19013/g.44358  ORF Transcript_19013/g.44358 Transcript_19013/m.44358 type:complete len:323 (+) Transcript_19013:51-1019(+)